MKYISLKHTLTYFNLIDIVKYEYTEVIVQMGIHYNRVILYFIRHFIIIIIFYSVCNKASIVVASLILWSTTYYFFSLNVHHSCQRITIIFIFHHRCFIFVSIGHQTVRANVSCSLRIASVLWECHAMMLFRSCLITSIMQIHRKCISINTNQYDHIDDNFVSLRYFQHFTRCP